MAQIVAKKLIRKMRGGSQAHLIEASDGCFYIVKFLNNPQNRRVLINELIGHEILSYLQIATPHCELVEIREDFLVENPGVSIRLGKELRTPEIGMAFGSRFPGDPNRIGIYDFVPDSLMAQVQNLTEFLAVLIFDKWVGNTDGRQVIFLRTSLKEWLPQADVGARKKGFVALMIDNGFIFGGSEWRFADSCISGLYPRRMVYRSVESLDDFEPWLSRVRHFPEELLLRAVRRIPLSWLEGNEEDLARLLELLLRRRRKIDELVETAHAEFPRWAPRP